MADSLDVARPPIEEGASLERELAESSASSGVVVLECECPSPGLGGSNDAERAVPCLEK